ncbi:alpha/beta fold hydrolase [Nocardia exalbida]|uniref:alpha/beta fold hydrolase n=1 Tax=Nocardia exalbida TaxID=290231 RepID=UPI0005929787|nr:alpha/beta fold hydrolase [Nocardia exalbida]
MNGSTAVHLADQGYFWVGVEVVESGHGAVVDGTALYVEYQIPHEQTQPFPLVFIHGGGAQGLDWIATPDGRPGWRTLALQRGYAVYVLDRPGHGRAGGGATPSGWRPTVDGIGTLFAGGDNPDATQWPGTGTADDPTVANVLAGAACALPPPDQHQELMRRRGSQLLDRIGPAVLIANSAGCAPAWLMADSRPDMVKAVVALEPLGPSMSWAVTEVPMAYEPPASTAEDLGLVEIDPVPIGTATKPLFLGEPPPMLRQSGTPRRLPHLAQVPLAVVTGQASFAKALDSATVDYLRGAGCQVDHLELGDLGIYGNGHLAMLEKNNADVLVVVLEWIEHRTGSPIAAQPDSTVGP